MTERARIKLDEALKEIKEITIAFPWPEQSTAGQCE